MVLFAILQGTAAVGSAFFGNKARKKAKRAAKLEAKARRLQKFIEQRRLLREARRAEAAALSAGVSQGVGLESSGLQGVLASIATQRRDQFTASQVVGRLESLAGVNKRSAASARATSGMLAGLASAAGSFKKTEPGKEPPEPRTTPTVETEIEIATGVSSRPRGDKETVNQSPFFIDLEGR